LNDPVHGEAVHQRLIDLMREDRDSTTRGFAAQSLASSDRPEAIQALLEALEDKGHVRTPNGSPSDGVGRRAEQAIREIEARTGRSIPRNPVGP
jgi:hypothetical protein